MNNEKDIARELKKTLSPLTTHKKWRSWIERAIIPLLAIGCIYFIFKTDDKPKNTPLALKTIETGASTLLDNPPQLTITPKQQARLAENLKQLDNELTQKTASDAQKLAQLREAASSLVYYENSNSSSSERTNASLGSADQNATFSQNVSSQEVTTVKARQLENLNTLLAQGNILSATLESRISSDLPGMVRAITSSDVYSEDNSTLLLPKGSRLIGQYNSAIAQGQNRVFILWQRLIRPDGVDIQLGSPGTDPLGGSGSVASDIDHHFMAQFGTAALLSVIGAGAANMGVNNSDNANSAAAYRSAVATSFSQTAQTSLQQTGVIKPTIYINQGERITVFVAKDLDFSALARGES